MANTVPLSQVGKGNYEIKKYIITDNPQTLLRNDNTGNIIVYQSDGEPISFADFDNEDYRDLYIGDEHVAGGFGFKNVSTRNEILKSVTEEIPETLKSMDSRLDIIEQVFGSIGDDYQDPNIKVNPQYNTIETSYGVYKLVYETGELRVVNDVKPNIYDVKLTFEDTTVTDKEIYNHDIFKPFKLSKLSFIYEGTAEPEAFYLSYRGMIKNITDYDIDVIGKYNNPVKMRFNRLNWGVDKEGEPTTKYIKDIQSLYFLKNPNKYPNSVQILVEITFNNFEMFGSELKDFEDEYLFRLAIIDKNNKKVVKTIGHATLTYPIYYGAYKYVDTVDGINDFVKNTVTKVFSKTFINDFDTINDIVYHHTTRKTYGWLFIPKTIYGLPVERPSLWFNGDIYLKTKWHSHNDCTINGTDMIDLENPEEYTMSKDYIVYYTPNEYANEVKWQIKLEKLM